MNDEIREDEMSSGNGFDLINNNFEEESPVFKQEFNNVTLPCIFLSINNDVNTNRKYKVEITEEKASGDKSRITVCCFKHDVATSDKAVALWHAESPQELDDDDDTTTCSTAKLKTLLEYSMGHALEIIQDHIQCLLSDSEHNTKKFLAELKECIKCTIHDSLEKNGRKSGNYKDETTLELTLSKTIPKTKSVHHFKQHSFEVKEATQDSSFLVIDPIETKSTAEVVEGIVVQKTEAVLDSYTSLLTVEDKNNKSNTNKVWQIDNESWKECFKTNDVKTGRHLLDEGKIPDGCVFQQVCISSERRSELTKVICKSVCSYIEGISDRFINVWPAYEFKKGFSGTNDIVFVVLTKNEDVELLKSLNYKIYQRPIYKCSEESSTINQEERERKCFGKDTGEMMNCINENTESMMKKHSNITMISESWIRSVGFGTDKAGLYEQPCIVLYTHVKGLIPLSEEPFPTELNGFPVDVREAVFRPLGGPNEYHDHIKMGCAIRNGDIHGQCSIGTIGGFIQHPSYGLCCTTSAHVLLGDLNTIDEHHVGFRKLVLGEHNFPVYQPTCVGARPFGNLVEAIYYEGSLYEAGVDVALIRIQDRFPLDGDFPESQMMLENGFDNDDPMVFRSGKIRERGNLTKGDVVLKYGACSEVTRGVFRTNGGAIRQNHMVGKLGNFDFLLRNQIEILNVGNKPFAVHGDSGALVFVQNNGELLAIGVLEGDMGDGRYMITPICGIFRVLGMPEGSTMKSFEKEPLAIAFSPQDQASQRFSFSASTPLSKHFSSSFSDSGISMSSSVESMAFLGIVEEKLKVMDEDIINKLEKQSVEIKQEVASSLGALKESLKEEFEQSQKAHMEQLQQMLAQFFGRK